MDIFNPSIDGFSGAHRELVLIGPPGTGKTRAVLTSWLQPALSAGVAPASILGCSFTTAAANEMRTRLSDGSGLTFQSLRRACKTIHSESLRLARSSGSLTELFTEGPKTASKESLQMLEEKVAGQVMISDTGAAGTNDLGVAVMDAVEAEPAVGGWEQMSRPERQMEAEAKRLWDIARNRYPHNSIGDVEVLLRKVLYLSEGRWDLFPLIAAVEEYEETKSREGKIDFTDMLRQALDIEPPSRRLLIVDEAQDLSPLQISVARRWGDAAEQMVWVGDPDQGIYGFAGADGSHLTSLMQEGIPARRLSKSWRVPGGAHRLARSLIQRNGGRVDAPYEPASHQGEVTHHDWHEEVVGMTLASDAETMILARSARQLSPYARALSDAGEPFVNERGPSPLQAPKRIRLLRAILAIRNLSRLDLSMSRALVDSLPGRPKGMWFSGTKKSALGSIKEMEEGAMLSVAELKSMGVKLDRVVESPSVEGLLRELRAADGCEALLRIVERHGEGALTEKPRIRLTTIHASKGRESDAVVVDLQAPLPTLREVERGEGEMETERRVLYVAITRVKRHLALVHPANPGQSLGVLLGL